MSEIFVVGNIQEADYGCEDTGRKEPAALLKLIPCPGPGDPRYVEVAESIIAKRGIAEGKKVIFDGDGNILKYVRVVAAVIVRDKDGEEQFFATARGYGEFKGRWEFPGGKIEEGESPADALKREIREELTAEIEVGDRIGTIEYDYPDFHLSMDCFKARVVSGELILKEAQAAKWLSPDEFDTVGWLPADLELLDKLS